MKRSEFSNDNPQVSQVTQALNKNQSYSTKINRSYQHASKQRNNTELVNAKTDLKMQ